MKSPLLLFPRAMVLGALWLLAGAFVFAQPAAKPVPVILETELGQITLEVDVAHAPITGANFLKYVDGRFNDGGLINRSVRPDNTRRHDVEIQVIQLQSNPARKKELFPAIPLERTNVTKLKHVDGTISMARDGPDSATSSFFITIGDQPSLDFGGKRNADGQGFAAFGRVVGGMDVVKKIQASPSGKEGEFGTETLTPPIKILKAYRAVN
jgi:peptidyl-prolyl cis-trans isomerase A (cyclophilin A)